MTTKELLESYLEREKNHMFYCSADYHMNRGKPGREDEFKETQERATLLEELLASL